MELSADMNCPDSFGADWQGIDLAALVAAVAGSPIVVARPAAAAAVLPPGFDATDIAILSWIAAEARRLRRLTLV